MMFAHDPVAERTTPRIIACKKLLSTSPVHYFYALYVLVATVFVTSVWADDFADDACNWGTPECIPLPNSPCCTSNCKLRQKGLPCASQGKLKLMEVFSKEAEPACRGAGFCNGKQDVCIVPVVAEADRYCKLTRDSNANDGQCLHGFCTAKYTVTTRCDKHSSLGVCCSPDGQSALFGDAPPYIVSTNSVAADLLDDPPEEYKYVIKVYPVAPECLVGGLSFYKCLLGTAVPEHGMIQYNNAAVNPSLVVCGRGFGKCTKSMSNGDTVSYEITCQLHQSFSTCPSPLKHLTINECEDVSRCQSGSPVAKDAPCNVNQECSAQSACDGSSLKCPKGSLIPDNTLCHNELGTCTDGQCRVTNQCKDTSFVNYCEKPKNSKIEPCCKDCVLEKPNTRCKIDCYKASTCDGKSSTCPTTVWTADELCDNGAGKCGKTEIIGCRANPPPPLPPPPTVTSLCTSSSPPCISGACCDTNNCDFLSKGASCKLPCPSSTTCNGDNADCPCTIANTVTPGVCNLGKCVARCDPDKNPICCNADNKLPTGDTSECGSKIECYALSTCDATFGTCPAPTKWMADADCPSGAGKCGKTPAEGCVRTTPAPPPACFGPLSCDPSNSDSQCCDSTRCKQTDMTPCTLPASYAPKFGLSHDGECYNGQCLSICEKRGVCTNPGSECCDENCQPLQTGLTCGNGAGKCSARGTCEQTVCPLFQDSNSGTTLNGCECRDTLHACQLCCEPTLNSTLLAQDPSNQCRPVETFVSSPQVLSNAHISPAQTVKNAGSQCLTYGQCDTAGGVCKPNYTALTPATEAALPAPTATDVANATPKPIGKRVSPALLARVAYLAGKEGKPGATVPSTPSLRERFAQGGALQMIAMDIFYVLWKFCRSCVIF